MRNTDPSRAVCRAVDEREDKCCAICGRGDGEFARHHRRPRGLGGTRRLDTNGLSNIVLLCRSCHDVVESHRSLALLNGWLVSQHADPAVVPFFYRRRWVLLSDLGAVEPTEVAS